MALQGKKLLVGMTGGIACYKVPYLVRELRRAGVEVRIVMTSAACKFITPLTMETVSENPVATEMFPADRFVGTHHIDMARWPDLIVVAPATANFLGKVASGISDDLLTTVMCAAPGPVLVAPAMNPGMWNHPSTQRNVDWLRKIGYHFVGPDEGQMACDQQGVGRMVEPSVIFETIKSLIDGKTDGSANRGAKKKSLSGKRILVTAGPCREPLDPVRYISNRSSGKMGYALAQAAQDIGARVVLVSGPTSLKPPAGVEFVSVETTAQMFEAVSARFDDTDYLIMAAAPSDFAPDHAAEEKIKKQAAALGLTLVPTIDILKTVSARKRKGQVLVGFALETEDAIANARKKLEAKNLDLIVLNSPRDDGAAFDSDTNLVTIIRPGQDPDPWPIMPKTAVARRLLDLISGLP
jgi:phosphopantothenoylcysteine decarboxylase / phosphopantothenate---cysteine ligase